MAEGETKVKGVISLNYNTYCMDLEDALAVAKALVGAEIYKAKYEQGETNHYIYGQELGKHESISITILPPDMYRMAKLAGKPVEDKPPF